MLVFCNLFSGSGGNATYIGTEKDAVLVDCGMSAKQVLLAMSTAGLDASLLRGILITHEHSDHIRGVDVLSRKLGLPVVATAPTQEAMDGCLKKLSPYSRMVINPGESLFFSSMECSAFSIPHDAAGPVGYRIFTRDGSAACATDMGYFTLKAEDALQGCDVLLLESNHDPDLLWANPNYPQRLKERIIGKKGHLSNEQCARAAVRLCELGTKHFLLGHLSGENNTPELAAQVVGGCLRDECISPEEASLSVASQNGPTRIYRIGSD